ncbi:DUF4442 domain-containing protein [Thalassomonas actiniarum]|uniref:DUF4442 domain-containing protein n=1 Tax=Thalassomonas actiniarum TaxID=485447 RepID=A0AAE9YKK4_9GAMM|nr:DUF4442 domain-containing protein [Thalassomonas actiniarum]WDD97092.1 DUF4442 domain-containing protein [Thalassomonas actiniarum]
MSAHSAKQPLTDKPIQTIKANSTAKLVNRLARLPAPFNNKLLSFVVGFKVPYVSTTGVRIRHLDHQRADFFIKNKRKSRNHLGGVHAVAAALLAESATGLLIAMNVPDTSVAVIKTMTFNFAKRQQGDMRAEASLTPEQIADIRGSEKGETLVKVALTDGTGREPIICEMLWAWVPKKRPQSPSE